MAALLCFGEVLVDLLPSDEDGSQHKPIAGGAPANVAVGFAKLGGISYFAGGVSTDNYGVFLTKELQQQHVKIDYLANIADAPTATVLVTLDQYGERSFTFNRTNTADLGFTASDFDKINWQNFDIFHFCSNTLTDDSLFQANLHGLQLAKSKHKLISFDVNLRPSLWENEAELAKRVAQCLPYSHIVKMSYDEWQFLAKHQQMSLDEYKLFCLAQGVQCLLITNGAKPVICINKQESVKIAVPAVSVVDTTAAGDSFMAGFLYTLASTSPQNANLNTLISDINNRKKMHKAIKFAIACGAFTCGRKGAFPALPTSQQWQE